MLDPLIVTEQVDAAGWALSAGLLIEFDSAVDGSEWKHNAIHQSDGIIQAAKESLPPLLRREADALFHQV